MKDQNTAEFHSLNVQLEDGKVVHAIRMALSDNVLLSVWEPETRGLPSSHSTITTIGGRWFGRLGCRRYESDLPYGSDERIADVNAFHAEQYAEAVAIIEAMYPEAAHGRQSMGEVSVPVGAFLTVPLTGVIIEEVTR